MERQMQGPNKMMGSAVWAVSSCTAELALGCTALPVLTSMSGPISREAIWAVHIIVLEHTLSNLEGALYAESGGSAEHHT